MITSIHVEMSEKREIRRKIIYVCYLAPLVEISDDFLLFILDIFGIFKQIHHRQLSFEMRIMNRFYSIIRTNVFYLMIILIRIKSNDCLFFLSIVKINKTEKEEKRKRCKCSLWLIEADDDLVSVDLSYMLMIYWE